MLNVCFLWHMHQPDYRDPWDGTPLMPWVRLHATRGYYDMAKALLEAPEGVSATVNFAPSLVEQLQSFVNGGPRDRFWKTSHKETKELSFEERRLLLKHFFSVSRETGIKPRRRYQELLEKRDSLSLEEATARFSIQELLDLSVLFYLSWFGWAAREDFPRLKELETKGKNFTEHEKREVLLLGDEVTRRVLPLYQELQKRGKAELTATPYSHPILPLLVDSDAAKRARPDLPTPPRFAYPEDARWHVKTALSTHRNIFGQTPVGMWPAEGSISPEVLPIFEGEGVRWIASDEGVLLRSIDSLSREAAITRPWRLEGSSVDLVFRDRELSDRIGFQYSKMEQRAAVDDFLRSVEGIERGLPNNEPSILCIILDGENPWEHYPDGGRAFLRGVYTGLGKRCVSIKNALSRDGLRRGSLHRLHSGSWIEASYRIWIGGEADNRAWSFLGAARRALEEARQTGEDPTRLEVAQRELYIAEGSDWFWWYGDDFASEEKGLFDSLFRGRLIAAYHALQKDPPETLATPVEASHETPKIKPTTTWVQPTIDGKRTSFYEWVGAGEISLSGGRASMFSGSEPFERLLFGFDKEHLFLRLDPRSLRTGDKTWHEGLSLSWRFETNHSALQLRVDPKHSQHPQEPGAIRVAFGEVFEASIPLSALGVTLRENIQCSLLIERNGRWLSRYPVSGPLLLQVPDASTLAAHWRL